MERGPKVYATPDDLSELNGPGFKFVLNHNDHRWTVTFKRQSPSVHWIDKYKQVSMSRSFQFDVEDDWVNKLKCIHEWAWSKWALAVDLPELSLPSGENAQTPGEISESD